MKQSIFAFLIFIFNPLFLSSEALHPIYISVTEIEHNAKAKSLEISCKIFTNDFETLLKKNTSNKIDLLHPQDKVFIEKTIDDYIQQHLAISVDGSKKKMKFIGYEQVEECIECYFEIDGIKNIPKRISVYDDILYDYSEQQMSLIHVIVNNERKSTKLNNPEKNFVFNF